MDVAKTASASNRLSAFSGVMLLLLCALFAATGLLVSFSAWGRLELLAIAVGAAGLLVKPRRARALLCVSGPLLIVCILAVRVVAAGSGSTQVLTLPAGTSSRWLARFVDEQDVSLLGALVLNRLWHLQGAERDSLVGAMHDAYAEMRASEGITASPVLDTFLQRQEPKAFDTIVIEPQGTPRAGVIFLHGYAGSFALECFLVAQAARSIGAVTICPAVDFSGHWTNRRGEETVRATFDELHARGVQRVFLAGLSNGGLGAAALAPDFAAGLKGLILISGSPNLGGSPDLPTLVVQGDRDAMASPANARAFAVRAQGTYAGFSGGHFVLLVQRFQVREAIARWLRSQ